MKKMYLGLLLLLAQLATAQTSVFFPPGRLASQEWVKAYVDSVLKTKVSIPISGENETEKPPVVEVTPPVVNIPVLLPCDAGPEILTIKEVTTNGLAVQFHGANVFGIDWQISDGSKVVRSGNIKPTSSWLPIQYETLIPGDYTLKLFGSTCQGRSEKAFKIPGKATGEVIELPPPPTNGAKVGANDQFELFHNLTGYGYDPADPTGINAGVRERIEAYRYDWGYGITGIRLCVRWYEWEPQSGQYTREGIQKVIAYCKARGLKLSIFFWPWRMQNDGFIPEGHVVTGDRGKQHEIESDKRMGSLASDVVNAKIYRAVKELSKELATYEGGYYLSIGTAEAEEFINPFVHAGRADAQLGGFEGVFQDGFAAFRKGKGRAYERPNIHHWDNGAALDMRNETGKDFARFVSLSLTRYFENFTRAVHEGGGRKILSCYMYPDAGQPQNGMYLHANFASQAASADAMYGTDGIAEWDSDLKLLCNAINLGMGKISINEYDPEDLGQQNQRYCGGINLAKVREEFEKSYRAGTHVVSFAMAFCPEEIRAMEPQIRYLWQHYIGKPYKKPDWPYTVVPIADQYFKGESIYKPSWNGRNFLIPDDSDFWGEGSRR